MDDDYVKDEQDLSSGTHETSLDDDYVKDEEDLPSGTHETSSDEEDVPSGKHETFSDDDYVKDDEVVPSDTHEASTVDINKVSDADIEARYSFISNAVSDMNGTPACSTVESDTDSDASSFEGTFEDVPSGTHETSNVDINKFSDADIEARYSSISNAASDMNETPDCSTVESDTDLDEDTDSDASSFEGTFEDEPSGTHETSNVDINKVSDADIEARCSFISNAASDMNESPVCSTDWSDTDSDGELDLDSFEFVARVEPCDYMFR